MKIGERIRGFFKRDFGVSQDDDLTILIKQLSETQLTREQVLGIPAVNGCIEYIAGKIAPLPIKLYKKANGKIEEVKNDSRTRIINIDTGDMLSGAEWKKAIVEDYFLTGGAYSYKNSHLNEQFSLHYIKRANISAVIGVNPIYKSGYYIVNGQRYEPYQMIKVLRKTQDGLTGQGLMQNNMSMLSLAYNSLRYENSLLKTGGNKRGFLTSENKLTNEQLSDLKEQYRKLYSNGPDASVVILNKGIKFEQASSTSVELQLGENRERNAADICKLFGVSPSVIAGGGTEDENSVSIRNGVKPVMDAIEAALNRDYLLEGEKDGSKDGAVYYFAFDDKMLDKGELVKRYQAYGEAVKAGWISKNEIRYKEDMSDIDGLDIISMSLGDVIFDVKTQTYYTPNKDAQTKVGEGGEKLDEG